MKTKKINGVPDFTVKEYKKKQNKYCLLIPILNEGERIKNELQRAQKKNIGSIVDIIICDGKSSDGSTDDKILKSYDVNTLLTKTGDGRQGAQLRMGIYYALQKGYEGILLIFL